MEKIEQELNDLSPLLASIPKDKFYKDVPKDYFEKLDDLVLAQLDTKASDPTLMQRLKGLFRGKESIRLNRIDGQNRKVKILILSRNVAAAVVIGFICFAAFNSYSEQKEIVNDPKTLPIEDYEILEYLVDDIEWVIDYDLLEEEDFYVIEYSDLYSKDYEENILD